MMLRIRWPARRRSMGAYQSEEVNRMKWETPQAVDYRFGMEITMYIANR
jgi:coenzyme PQQ precursor peptide PqqA